MRYYDIQAGNGWRWSSHDNGLWNPGAQQVEFTLEVYSTPKETNNSSLTVYGVSWDQLIQANTLIDKPIDIYGGMMDYSLPLANYQSRNKGLLVRGTILQCWGNWVGTEMSIGMVIGVGPNSVEGSGSSEGGGGNGGSGNGGNSAGTSSLSTTASTKSISKRSLPTVPVQETITSGVTNSPFQVSNIVSSAVNSVNSITSAMNLFGSMGSFVAGGVPGLTNPLNLIHNMLPMMPLNAAMQETLSRALPQFPIRISISNLLKLAYQDAGVYQSVEQYIQYINKLSQSILGAQGFGSMGSQSYPGVHASSNGTTLDIWDGPAFGSADITAGDLIGQPTWIERNLIQVKTVLRADLTPPKTVTISPTLMTLTPDAIVVSQNAAAPQRTNVMGGGLHILKTRYIGDYRNPDGNNWCTIIECEPMGLINVPTDGTATTQAAQTLTLQDIQRALINNPSILPQSIPQIGRMIQRGVR